MRDWPCKLAALDSARAFVRDAASKGGKVVLAPDRDADGLCAGKMSCSMWSTLALTGIVQSSLNLHTLCTYLISDQAPGECTVPSALQ